MNQDEHQRERIRVWTASYIAHQHTPSPGLIADHALNAFDARFPAPAAEVAPIQHGYIPAMTVPIPDQSAMGQAVAGTILAQEAEIATLREKARLWDAVASRKVRLTCDFQGMFAALFDKGEQVGGWQTSFYTTAAEAVQAAIDAGALK